MEKMSAIQSQQKKQDLSSNQKLLWEKPTLSTIGKLREIVHGAFGSMGDGTGGGKQDNPHKP